MINFIHYCD